MISGLVFDEPLLEFGGGNTHIDPRHGLLFYGPADLDIDWARANIRVGIIGTQDQIDGLSKWLERCRSEIAGKSDSDLPGLFPAFPGFDDDSGFHCRIGLEDKSTYVIAKRKLDRLAATPGNESVREAVDLYREGIAHMAEKRNCDVILCARPDEDIELDRTSSSLAESVDREEVEPSVRVDEHRLDFHDLLKAQTLRTQIPLQLIRRATWEGRQSNGTRGSRARVRRQQDEATRAWNLHTAIYYKAKRTPWRLPRSNSLTTLYIVWK
jgi:hypothetical protein